MYVSLTGERLEGRRGLCQQRQDQLAEAYSNWSVRSELVQVERLCNAARNTTCHNITTSTVSP